MSEHRGEPVINLPEVNQTPAESIDVLRTLNVANLSDIPETAGRHATRIIEHLGEPNTTIDIREGARVDGKPLLSVTLRDGKTLTHKTTGPDGLVRVFSAKLVPHDAKDGLGERVLLTSFDENDPNAEGSFYEVVIPTADAQGAKLDAQSSVFHPPSDASTIDADSENRHDQMFAARIQTAEGDFREYHPGLHTEHAQPFLAVLNTALHDLSTAAAQSAPQAA